VPTRPILVDGVVYRWRVKRLPADYPGFVELAAWRDGRPRGRAIAVRIRFDDPWLNFGPMVTTPKDRFTDVWQTAPVTPKHVAAIIRAARERGWDPDADVTTPMALDWDGTTVVGV
jgi:hypothetical protein